MKSIQTYLKQIAENFGYKDDGKLLSSQNYLRIIASNTKDVGGGDMTKAEYDTDGNGSVDSADSVPWTGVTGKPALYTQAEVDTIISNLQQQIDNLEARVTELEGSGA